MGVNISCEEYKIDLVTGLESYQVLALSVPENATVWSNKTAAWDTLFYIYSAVGAILFLAIGVLSTALGVKKDCARIKTKTFFIVYTCIAVLGYSKFLWFVLDPFSLFGYISDQFTGWFVITRLIDALGFPSIVASYTLIIATLFKISSQPGTQWYQKWTMVLPILISPYLIVFTAEVIALTAPYPALLSVIICEFVFTLWAWVVCVLFMVAGVRLLKKLKRRELASMRVSDVAVNREGNEESNQSTAAARKKYVSTEQKRRMVKLRGPKRRITLITFATAFLEIIYSLVALGRAVLTCYLLYSSCLGFGGHHAPSEVWLALEIAQRVTELTLALVLLYSISDLSTLQTLFCSKCSPQSNQTNH